MTSWIPFGVWFACADSVTDGEEKVKLFGSIEIPAMLYKLWWIAAIIVWFIPTIGMLLAVVLRVVFLGNAYTKMYAKLDGNDVAETQAIGYISGFITLVATVKFLIGKYNE